MLIYACDGLDQIGQITGWSDLSVTERDLDVGSWSIEIPLDGADAATVDRWLDKEVQSCIEVHDPETGWRFGGPAIIKGYEVTPDGSTASLKGVDWMCLLPRRVYHQYTTDPTLERVYESFLFVGKVTALLHSMANSQLALQPSDALAYRKVPELSGVYNDDQGSFVAEGDIVNYQVDGGTTLLEMVRAILAGQDFTCRLRLDRRVDAGAEVSSIRFSTPAREASNTRLSIANGGYSSAKVTDTLSPSTMTIAVGGVPDYDDPLVDPRQVTWARRPATQAGYWLYGEQYLDLDGLWDETLQTEFYAAHVDARTRENVTFEGVEVEGWGRQVDLGWYVAAEVGIGGKTRLLDLPVSAFELSGKPGALTKKMSVGDYEPEGVVKMLEMIRGVTTRLGKLERRPRG